MHEILIDLVNWLDIRTIVPKETPSTRPLRSVRGRVLSALRLRALPNSGVVVVVGLIWEVLQQRARNIWFTGESTWFVHCAH